MWLLTVHVDRELADSNRRALSGSVRPKLLRPSQDCVNAGNQLVWTERLRDVVVDAQFQSGDLVHLR